MSNRTTVIDHPSNEQTPTVHGQPGISVGHEGLQGEQRRQTSPLSREALPIHKPNVTNVPAEYN